MDISATLAPKSDQLDAVDLSSSGPRTFTIVEVSKNNPDQPVNVKLAEFPRVWRPGLSMRRVLAACWGTETDNWIGKRVRLYCDDRVQFGGEAIGGTRIEAVSHIEAVKKVPLIVTRGRVKLFTVQPLTDEPAAAATPAWTDLIGMATTRAELTSIREQAKAAKVTNGAEIDRLLAARATELDAEPPADEPA